MEKAYSRINWKNGSRSTDTPLNETNMNLMDSAIDVIDGRVCQHDAQIQTLQGYETRAAQSAAEALQSAQDAEDSATDSANSATESSGYATNSSASATQSQNYSRDSEAWAKGTRNGTAVPSTDETYENNSKYYAEQAQQIVDDFTIDNETPTFTQASTRTNINSGETISTIMGKIKKIFADLKKVAFTGNASDVSFDNTGTTSSATTVQAGLKEALTNSAPTASNVPYTNTTSGLSATNVQSAIDEVNNIKITLVTFSDLSKYGIAISGEKINATLEEICKKMPAYCEVKIMWTGSDTTRFGTLANQIPESFGSLYIHKMSSVHPCIIEFIPYNSGNHYVRNYDYVNSTDHLSNWVNLNTVASIVPYTNTTSGLSATNVQSAIDEVVATKQIANGVCANWSSAQAISTSYQVVFHGGMTNYSGGVAITSLLKGKPYKLTITGTCANVTNNIDVVVALKTANTTSGVDTDMVTCAIGSTKISGTSFTIETELLIPKTVSPAYCQYWIKKSSSSTTVTINSISAKWEEIGVYDALKIGDDNIQSRISNVETKGLSSQAYSTGQYFTHGDKLKKVTSAIASGDVIGGGNTSDTTIGSELTTINNSLTKINSDLSEKIVVVSGSIDNITVSANSTSFVEELENLITIPNGYQIASITPYTNSAGNSIAYPRRNQTTGGLEIYAHNFLNSQITFNIAIRCILVKQ